MGDIVNSIFRRQNNRIGYVKLVLAGLALFSVHFFGCQNASELEISWNQVPEILSRIVPPEFPANDFPITDFGANGDGKTDCSGAFKNAIEKCHAAGGGRVTVSNGIFLTGAIHLKSNVNLHITENATILFCNDTKKYLPVVFTRFEGVECMNYSPFIYAFEQENIAITGEGTLDGQADSTIWWSWAGKIEFGASPLNPDQNIDRDALFQMAEDGIPVEDRIFGEGHYLRINFIQPYKCKNILIEGVTIKRSPMWEIHPVLCENVTVQNVTIISHGPNNDGCNPESSKDVLIKNCYFNTGDDCIAIKSGRNADGRRVNVASENIIIQGCTMKDGHGGVVIGSEISGSCRNVFAEDCVMDSPNLERALRIKTNSMRGGIVENIFMRNVAVGEVSDAVIRIFFHYGEGDVGQYTPIVRNIDLSHITSQKSKYALYFAGYERSPISNINIKDCEFNGVENGTKIDHIVDLKMKNVFINGEPAVP
ncbi:glycoside hydrolase family 28 protein [candidate division KSB1 bacterium]|nr:glycoside hydrolase family 28 protein [candidate division KSB1 bacterium]